MSEQVSRPVLIPGPTHPISIEPHPREAVVRVAGRVVARSGRALVLREAGYAPVLYFPPEDVDFSLLEASDHSSYCPFKGEAGHYSVPAGGERSENAVWQYCSPHPAVVEIEGHLAFYSHRVDRIG